MSQNPLCEKEDVDSLNSDELRQLLEMICWAWWKKLVR